MESFKQSQRVVCKPSENELVLLHTETGHYYTLNQTGRAIWEYCSAPKTLEEIVAYVQKIFEGSADTSEKDLQNYLALLCAEKLLSKD
jgi:hypothetical protein